MLLIVAALSGFYALSVFVAVAWPATGWILAILTAMRFARKGYARLTTLGSARFAQERDMRRTGMLNAKSGLILGRML
jgi:type IV secretory pathway TraG/TraD family ATPase VirD4